MTESELVGQWRKHLAAQSAGMHLVDPSHSLQIFVGITDLGAARLVVRSAIKPSKPTLSDLVLVDRYEDQAGRWNLSLTLQDSKFDEVFLRLADDVHARSAQSPNEESALDRVGVVFDEWRRLLRPRSRGVLTMDELRGLVGELWLLLNVFTETRPLEAALEGWLGPMGLPQDFWYPESGYHEAKSIGPAMGRVKISSENQLDASPLELVVLQIGNTDDQTVGAISLITLVAKAKAALSAAAANAEPLDERLDRLGVNLGEAFYQDTWFVVSRATWYDVNGDFPAIRASSLAASLSRVTYQIELAAIEDFKRNTLEVD